MNKKLLFAVIFVAIFSAIAEGSPSITINSPYDLDSGENVLLSINSNETILLNYSLDNSEQIFVGSSNSFNLEIEGTLLHGVLNNGDHSLTLRVVDNQGNVENIGHDFNVEDLTAPLLSLNITNNTKYIGLGVLPLWINSSEYSTLSYKVNSNNFSQAADVGIAKSNAINLSLSEGQNTLIFNISDYQNNSAIYSYTINYSSGQMPTCSDALQNGDETGIDCGGICSPCIEFSLSTNKNAYNLTDNVLMTVIARANSTVNVTVKLNNEVSSRYNIFGVFQGFPIYEQRVLSNTSNAGNYTIFAKLAYLNTTETKNSTFEIIPPINNPLSITINANTTVINEGNTVQFSSTVLNNLSAVSFKWDFQNDGIIDSIEPNVSFTFGSNGTFNVNLTVSDTKWNQTDIEIITSRKLYNFTVIVRENSTQSAIHNAQVEIDKDIINTTSEGKADFTKHEDTYSIIIKRPGFVTFSNKTTIRGYALIEVSLIELDVYDPIIQLISPENGKTINNDSIKLVYKASDKSFMSCNLFTSRNSESWIRQATDSFVQPDTESSFTIPIDNTTYQWKIECFDRSGNINSSEPFSFISDQSVIENTLSVNLDEQDKISEDILTELERIISEIDLYDSDEKDAADAMQLKKQIERAKTEVQRANRDLHSLKWRRLNDTELEKETQAILKRVDDLKYTTPAKITILEKNEFVKYPSKDDVQAAIEPLTKKTNLKFTRKELRTLVDDNFEYQSRITVTTKARVVEIEYLFGNRNEVTLIEKSVAGADDVKNLAFLEVIPKEIAENTSKINALFDFEIIEQDPIIKIDISKFKEFAYYVEGRIDLKTIENIKSILVDEKIKKRESGFLTGFVTGFVPSDGFIGGFIKTLNLRLIIELAVILVLGVVFLYYQFGGYEKLELIFNRKLGHQMKEFDYLMVRITNYLDQGKYEESKILYNEINELFRQVQKDTRAKLYPKIIEVHARMDYTFMDSSLNEAFSSIDEKDMKKALRLYNKISSLYKSLPKDYKSKIHQRCIELYKKLNS